MTTKPTKKTAAPKTAARKHIQEDQKIVVLKGAEIALTEGSAAHDRVRKVLSANGKTVAAAKARGARQSTVAYCVRNKLIRVV
jgi:hypothetical protein